MSCPYLPGALIRCRRLRNRQRIGARRRRTDASQRHRLLQVSAADRELVAGELHAVDLPDAVAQRDPEAVAHETPASHIPAELRRAVAAHHDVADLIAGFRLPIPRQPVWCGVAPAAPSPPTGATGSVSTATCPSHCFIIRTNAPPSSGSNSRPLRSTRYPSVFSTDHASRYGRRVRNASYTS